MYFPQNTYGVYIQMVFFLCLHCGLHVDGRERCFTVGLHYRWQMLIHDGLEPTWMDAAATTAAADWAGQELHMSLRGDGGGKCPLKAHTTRPHHLSNHSASFAEEKKKTTRGGWGGVRGMKSIIQHPPLPLLLYWSYFYYSWWLHMRLGASQPSPATPAPDCWHVDRWLWGDSGQAGR